MNITVRYGVPDEGNKVIAPELSALEFTFHS